MSKEETKDEEGWDIYRFRRRKARYNQFLSPSYAFPDQKLELNLAHPRASEPHKTYAILQEGRTEFSNSKLRAILLIYSNVAWKVFVLTTLFIAYIMDSCLYAFCQPQERKFWAIAILICFNLIFTCDVIIMVGLKFFKKWRKTLNLMEPNTYLVILDVILALPFAFLYLLNDNLVSFNFHAVVPLVATIRVYRILQYFYNKSSQAGSNQWTTFLFQYLILFLLSVHTLTCVWYRFANKTFDIQRIEASWSLSASLLPTEATFDWYYVCTYCSVMYLTTNALGDLYPVTTIERLTAIIAILVGFLLTTVVFVGSLTSQFITITTRRSKYVRQLTKIQNHLRLINMDKDTTTRIIRYYEDLWYQKSGVFKPKLLALLPYPLQMEICYDLNAVPLYSSLIFRKQQEAFLRRLSLNMTHQFYLPGDVVYSHNQNKTIMVCITNGVLELLSDEDDESPMISLAKGSCFGEISLVYNIPARCTVKAATYVECQVLEKTKFIKLMVTYPDLVNDITKEINERIERAKERKKMQAEYTEFSLNVYASKDQKKSSIKCLKDKLRFLQGKTKVDTLTKDDHLDENCLDLYILSEHVKKKTALFTCLKSSFPWILESDCLLVKYWELYMLGIVCYICVAYPYYIGLLRSFPDEASFYAQIVIAVSLVLNIFMTSITAVKTKKKYITEFKSILNYRMNTLGFYLDLIAIIPFEYIVTIHKTVNYSINSRDHLFYMCKGIKLCLVWRVSSFFESLERKLMFNSILVKVVKYCVYICLLCYWCGIILYMESCFITRCSTNSWFNNALTWEQLKKGRESTKTEYPLVTSVYFATTILLSVGYGDFTPGDTFDMAFVAFLSLYGVLLTGYCISEFSAVVTHWSRTKTAFVEVIMTIDKFMKENNMHPAIKSRIMAFYELQWQYNSGVEVTDDNWLEKTVVPSELRKKVLHQARFKALTSIKFFQVKNKAYIQTLTETATDIILPPGEIVFYGGTVSRELYIIESGYCLVTTKAMRENNKERVIGPGNHLGLLVLLYGVPSVSTVITLTHCKLVCISHSAYTSALSLFPDMKEHEGLLTPEELKLFDVNTNLLTKESYLQHYNQAEKPKVKITNILQDFFNNSFIDLLHDYKKNKESYWKSYRQFKILNNIAPYILMPIVLKPDGIFLKVWALMRMTAAFLLCLMIPLVVSMAPVFTDLNIPIAFLETMCYVDMYLMLHVAYYGPKNQLIYHPYMTAKHYLQGQFVIDIVTCFPWYALWLLFVPKHDEGHCKEDHEISPHMYHCGIRMINVLQIIKLYTATWADSIADLKRAYIMSVVHFLLLTLFFLNLYACILLSMSCTYVLASDAEDFEILLERFRKQMPIMNTVFHPDGNMVCHEGSWLDGTKILKSKYITPTRAYLLAYYWAATSFGGAGFGDIVPQNYVHMILCNCVNVHGVLFFGYVYARIASLKAMADQVVTKFQENLKHLELFLNREKIPFSLMKTVMEYWQYQWKRTGGWSHQSILGKLHANLNEDAVLHMYEKTLREIPLFEDVDYSFFRAFAKKLRERYFQKGYLVIRANEVISTMYIIYRGKVDIMSSINEVEACMGPGGIFGNIRGASRYLTTSNVVASRNIDVLCIKGRDFYTLLKSYPSVLKKVKESVESAPKDYVLPTICVLDRSGNSVGSNYFPASYETGEDEEDDTDTLKYSDSPDKSVSESHGSKSISSATCADYIAAGFLLFKPHRWFRSSIVPDCRLVTFIEYIILFLSYMDFILVVYQMAFLSVPYYLYICIVIDIVFLYKLFLDIHSGYMNRYGDYVLNPSKVRKKYFSKVFLRRRDFLANFPFCYVMLGLRLRPVMKLAVFSYTRTPQLARISYLFTYRTHRKTNIGSGNLFIKLTTTAIWASILSHVNACLFFKLSCLTPVHCTSANWMSKPELNLRANYSEGSYFALYVAALWYVVNLVTITGTGDVSAQNSFEVIETIIVIIFIKFCTGLLISEMSAMITAHSSSRIAYDYDINELRDGLRDMDLSLHQMNKMWDYVRELWNRQQGKQMPALVYQLPFRLRAQVMEAVYGSHIRESVIFSKTDADFRRMLVMWMRHCVFFPGNYIVQCGDSDQCIYFIHRGQVEVLTVHPNLTESIYDVLGPEDSFGIAQGLFVGVPHHFSFRARTVVDIVYLKLDQWKYLLDYYPSSAKLVRRKVENVYLAI
ncbi:uncharacterized protein LOC142976664 [Anticarsia gemmatalis]|uniref:uncharacterized protein LOC142976664 n=1 Tax=Anticarsia gemmatalis TaxID=129554 RepID=UPI003F767067